MVSSNSGNRAQVLFSSLTRVKMIPVMPYCIGYMKLSLSAQKFIFPGAIFSSNSFTGLISYSRPFMLVAPSAR